MKRRGAFAPRRRQAGSACPVAVATAALAAAEPAAGALFAGPGFVDDERAPAEVLAVHFGDGAGGRIGRSHLDEGEAAGPAGFPVRDDAAAGHVAEGGEGLAEIALRGAKRQVANIQFGSHGDLFFLLRGMLP